MPGSAIAAAWAIGGGPAKLQRARRAKTWESRKVRTFFALQRLEIFEDRAHAKLEGSVHSPIRCLSSQTRRAASNKALVRVRLPAAASCGSELEETASFFERPRVLRAFGLRARWADALELR